VWVALVVASLVHALEHLHFPLELPAVVLATQVAARYESDTSTTPTDARGWLAVATIDENRFRAKYKGVRPLDRCQLADDLTLILENRNIQFLAVDFDLSSTGANDPASLDCQQRLDALLLEHAERLILIIPLADNDRQWMDEISKRAKAGKPTKELKFAKPELLSRFGVAWKYAPDTGTLGHLLSQRLCDLSGGERARLARCKEAGGEHHGAKPENISFRERRYLYNEGRPLTLDDPCLVGTQRNCDIRAVILGGTYGTREDVFTTPIGQLHGVDVHATIAAQTGNKLPDICGFALEVLLAALVFGPLAHVAWSRYLRQRVGRSTSHPHLAYRWLVLLAVCTSAIVMLVLYFAVAFYATSGYWLSPAPIAIGMIIEAAVTSGTHTACHLLENDQATSRRRLVELAKLSSRARFAADEVQPLTGQLQAATVALVGQAAALRDAAAPAAADDALPGRGAMAGSASHIDPDGRSALLAPAPLNSAALMAGIKALAESAQGLVDTTQRLVAAAGRAREGATTLEETVSSSFPNETADERPAKSQGAIRPRFKPSIGPGAQLFAWLPRLVGAALVGWAIAKVSGWIH
jgi:hypothetical protein